MAFTDTPKIGVDLGRVISPSEYPSCGHRVLSQIWSSSGKRYVFAKASGNITADNSSVSINTSTGAATDSGGSYNAPSVAVPEDSYAWFFKDSV